MKELDIKNLINLQILNLFNDNNKDRIKEILLNELIVDRIQQIIDEKGKQVVVKNGKRKLKLGYCYYNSTKKMLHDGYGYVEGIVIDKKTGYRVAHAWNIKNDEHIDFTIPNPDDYDYYGIIIPNNVVLDKMFGMSICVLPFI